MPDSEKRGGKRKGAGRPPVSEKKQSKTVTIRKDQNEWLATKCKGWFAKFIELGIDKEMNNTLTIQTKE